MFYLLNILIVLLILLGYDFLKFGIGFFNGFFVLILTSVIIFLAYYRECIAILRKQLWLVAFCCFGLLYMILSYAGVFSLLFGIKREPEYVFQQSYFLPLFLIFLPVFILFFQEGPGKYYNEKYFTKHPVIVSITLALLMAIFGVGYTTANILFMIPILFVSQKSRLAALLLVGLWYLRTYQSLVATIFVLLAVGYILLKSFPFQKYILPVTIIAVLILLSLGTSQLLRLWKIDPNSAWRFYVWKRDIGYCVTQTFGAGVGYGTSYFLGTRNDVTFLYFSTEGGEKNVDESGDAQTYIRGQHNSFVNTFYRLGVVGLSFLVLYLVSIYKKLFFYQLPSLYGLIVLFGMIHIGTNVGLESPGYFLQFVLVLGFVSQAIEGKESTLVSIKVV